MFLAGFGTYLVSKEIYVLEHEFYCGVALFGKCCRILLLGVKQKKFKNKDWNWNAILLP